MRQGLTVTGLEEAFHNYGIVKLSPDRVLVKPRGRKEIGVA